MIPYYRPKLSHLFTLSQSKLVENHTPHSSTYLYSPYVAVPATPYPRTSPPRCMVLDLTELLYLSLGWHSGESPSPDSTHIQSGSIGWSREVQGNGHCICSGI